VALPEKTEWFESGRAVPAPGDFDQLRVRIAWMQLSNDARATHQSVPQDPQARLCPIAENLSA
jgi:hypothetical protein